MEQRVFNATDRVTFKRNDDGSVTIVLDDHEAIIDDGTWGSAVLTMTKFNERPCDWHKFMDHHHGRKDLLT